MIPAAQSGRLPKTNSTRWRFHSGTLFEWPTAKRVYEVKEYRPEENVAVANWRESIAGSQLAGDCLVADAIDHIEEIRTVLEPEAQKADGFSDGFGRSSASSIGGAWKTSRDSRSTTTPSFGKSGATVSKLWPKKSPRI